MMHPQWFWFDKETENYFDISRLRYENTFLNLEKVFFSRKVLDFTF